MVLGNGDSECLLLILLSILSLLNFKSVCVVILYVLLKFEKNFKRILFEFRVDEDFFFVFKKWKICESVVNLMKYMKIFCEVKGELIGFVFGECCLFIKKVGSDVWEVFSLVMEIVVKEKGVKVVFLKFILEDVWEEKLKLMRVLDWIYLFFKLKSRILDCFW